MTVMTSMFLVFYIFLLQKNKKGKNIDVIDVIDVITVIGGMDCPSGNHSLVAERFPPTANGNLRSHRQR